MSDTLLACQRACVSESLHVRGAISQCLYAAAVVDSVQDGGPAGG